MRKVLATLSALALIASIPAQARTPVNVWIPWGGPDGEALIAAAQDFNKEQSEFEIQMKVVPAAGIDSVGDGKPTGQFIRAVNAGTPPDLVLYWGNDVIASLAEQNAILPLDELLGPVGLGSFTFNHAAWLAMKHKGKAYGIPEMINARLLFINADHAKAAGLDIGKPPTTIAELDAWSYRMTRQDPSGTIRRLGLLPWGGQGKAEIWTGYFGGSLIDSASGRPNVLNPGTVETARWFERTVSKLGAKHLAHFVASFNDIKQSSGGDPFIEGMVSMEINGAWHANFIKKNNSKLKYVVAKVPTWDKSHYGATFIDGNTWLLPRGSKNVQAALQFVAWLSQSQRSAHLADQVYNVSPVRDALVFQKSLNDKAIRLSVAMVSNANSFALAQSVSMMAVRRELALGFAELINGADTAQGVLSKAQARLSRLAVGR